MKNKNQHKPGLPAEVIAKEGYKKTRLGWIPEHWEVKKLKNIAFIDRESLGNGIPPDYEFTYISLSDIEFGKIVNNELPILTYSESPSRARRIVHKGDILLSNVRPNLMGYYIFKDIIDNTIVSTGFSVITPKDHVSGEYIYQSLYSNIFQRQFHALIVGSNYPAINSSDIKNLIISLPEYSEQQKIVQILTTWDKAIEKTEHLIAKKQERKKGLMQQLLTGKGRFLEFVKSDKMHDTKLGMIPEDWDIRKLKNIACIDKESLGNGISPDYKFTYISLSDIDNGKIISNKLPVLNYSNSPSRARRVVHIGDILLANVRPNLLGYYIFNKEVNNTIVSTGFSVITPKEKISGDFIYQYLYSSIFQRQLHGLIVGSNYPAINSYVVKSLKIPLPDYFEQQKIASVLSTADNEIEYLQNQLEKLKEQKKGLMQKLLTGEVRVRLN